MVINILAGFSIANVLNDWNSIGVFSYILPFLLIFSLVYAILEKAGLLGDNRGVKVIVALAVGLLGIVNDKVPHFFATIFPNLGIALSVLLVGIILLGLFFSSDDNGIKNTSKWIVAALGMLGVLFSIYYSFKDYSFGVNVWEQYGSEIISLLLIVGIVLMIVFWKK